MQVSRKGCRGEIQPEAPAELLPSKIKAGGQPQTSPPAHSHSHSRNQTLHIPAGRLSAHVTPGRETAIAGHM